MKARGIRMRLFTSSMILVACSLLLLTRAWAATVVSGNVSGTWTTNGSPYILSADCTVVSNQTLTIQPGVTAIIGPDITFWIYGGLTAVGTSELPIAIRGANSTSYWQRVLLYSSSFTNRFHYCRVSEASDIAIWFSVSGGNRVMTTEILNCDFLNCRNGAILGSVQAYASGPDTGDATLVSEVHNCVFDSTGNFGCVFSGLFSDPAQALIQAHLTGNVFKNIRGRAVQLYKASSSGTTNASKPLFINNTVVNCGRGVEADHPYLEPTIRNNLFVRSTNAVVANIFAGLSTFDAGYNGFFNNTANFVGYPGIYGIPVQINHNGDPCDAFFNIFLDPQFLDTNRFLLRPSSPCIDAGDPAIADVCFQFSRGSAISDIGTYGGPEACGWLTHGFAPVITGPLHDQSSCVGGSTTFKVRVDGSEPLSYRWYFNGTNLLAGETNAQLNLVNLEATQAGLYSVAISNTFGSVTSAAARLFVFDACVDINLYAGLSIAGMVGRTYTVDCATNLAATNWTALATNTFSEPRWLFIDTNTPFNPARYYRVRLQP